MSAISSTGFWDLQGKEFDHNHIFDKMLSMSLVNYVKSLQVTKMYDLGCGPGWYTKALRNGGIECTGIDGNPITSTFPHCKVYDLTLPVPEPKVDCVLCLEVGEHVPAQYETDLLSNFNNLLNPNGILILSWAIRKQPGFGHVNCLNNDEVIKKMTDIHFTYDEKSSTFLRNAASVGWFKNTIMVFRKN
jgi:2-polyprenyl-3-methyl-5-hydroxy-6-metoxy-1,4-benzoquinol methylase